MSEPLLITLAYKYAAVTAMLLEINYQAAKLHLPISLPLKLNDVENAYVSPPNLMGFGGSITTSNFFFGFNKSGQLRYVRNSRLNSNWLTEQGRWERMSSEITTNNAYSVATDWLSRIAVDVKGLETVFRPTTVQRFYYDRPEAGVDSPRRPLPVFDVFWGPSTNPAINVTIFGPTVEPIDISQNDVRFSLRPKNLLTNVDLLLGMSDRDFANLSQAGREGLLSKTLAVSYPLVENTERTKQSPSIEGKIRSASQWKILDKSSTNAPVFKKPISK